MPSKRTTKSNDSAVAEQILADQEKKKKEKEKKFLAAAKKRIDTEVAAAADDFNSSLSAVNDTFNNFVQQYAQCEDEIRLLWTRVEAEQKKMLHLAQARHALNVQADHDRQEGQIAGLAKMSEACKETQSLIELIDPSAA
ncbi:hypothetical protein BD626DRAFT_36937 [Schizophyllum amplum]|uniref:Uncharacterized protein n=1 Tax=Schizophyllum amplum TaxID=97359 RepID=A0A550CEU8_9AGAR|nr:hypothetical protein BD626DRAFT_36937 [Auriculariopsis ampla]